MKKKPIMRRYGDKLFQRLSSIFIALLLSVFLLAFPRSGYGALVEYKYVLFLAICGGYCAVTIIMRVALALSGKRPFEKPFELIMKLPVATMLLFLFLLIAALSAVLSEHSGTFIGEFRKEGALTIAIHVIACFLLSKYIRPKKWMLFLFGVSTCLFCLLSIVQLTGANPFTLYPQWHNYYGAGVYYSGEFIGTTGNAGLSAAFLSIATGVFAMSLIVFDFRKKWLLSVPLFLAVFLLFEMGIDAGLVALAGGLLLMLPVAVTNQKRLARTLIVAAVVISAFVLSRAVVFNDGYTSFGSFRPLFLAAALFAAVLSIIVEFDALSALFNGIKPRPPHPRAKGAEQPKKNIGMFSKIPSRWYRIVAVAIVLSVICAAFFYLWSYSGDSSGMLYEASEMLHGRFDDAYGTGRVYIWRNVLGGTKGHLLFGTGADTLGYWGIEPFTRYSEKLGVEIVSSFDSAHNEYLQILACQGILALLCYMGAMAFSIVKWFRQPDNAICAIAGSGVLFFCILAFFSINMFITAPFFWVCLAVLIYA